MPREVRVECVEDGRHHTWGREPPVGRFRAVLLPMPRDQIQGEQ